MSIFSDALLKAIADYRLLLRRHLTQVERVQKLNELGLRGSYSDRDEVQLYGIGMNIVNDIKVNLSGHTQGYYSYSGVRRFGEFLAEFLEQYKPHGNEIVHKAQQSSRSLLLAIQMVGMPAEQLDDTVFAKFIRCNEMIAYYGKAEQKDTYREVLSKAQDLCTSFYTRVFESFVKLVDELNADSLPERDAEAA